MKTYLITIGDEIIAGSTLNTNAAFLGKELFEAQFKVVKTSVVSDQVQDIKNELADASRFADIIISTGGLGPTGDDRTRAALLEFFQTELVEDPDVVKNIEARFERLGREVSKTNREQALVPKSAQIIKNMYGTAPGFWFSKNGKVFIFMPGVPFEMKRMFIDFVLPLLKELQGVPSVFTKRISFLTSGIFESALYDKLSSLEKEHPEIEFSYYPSPQGVKLCVTASAPSEPECIEKLISVEQEVRSKIGRFIYGKGEDTLAEVIGRLLKERGLRIALAESCTGGMVSSLLTDYPGSSVFFDRSIVAYSNSAKVEILGVSEDAIQQYGAVSEVVARQMALGVKDSSACDIGLSITGIMGPTGATTDKPIGLVFIGIAAEEGVKVFKFNFGDDRNVNKSRTAQSALDLLRKYLLGIEKLLAES